MRLSFLVLSHEKLVPLGIYNIIAPVRYVANTKHMLKIFEESAPEIEVNTNCKVATFKFFNDPSVLFS